MNTKELARQLGCIETIKVTKSKSTIKLNPYSIQPFQYLLVLDFEATCNSKQEQYIRPEIIEFSVVLYEIQTGTFLSEFQQYVMPTENHKLTEFCKNFTGIKQEMVDAGVPLGTCLMLFAKWLKQQESQFNIQLYKNEETKGNCVFTTWSNWDFGTCLLNECKRKRIIRSDYFKKWIDLKELYRKFYHRLPKGLNGALNEVGLEFVGKEHCGLDDARNTAFLAGQMIKDGALLIVTTVLTQ